MTSLMGWIVRHPAWAAALAIALTLAFTAGLDDLRLDSSTEGLMVPGDPAVAYYRDVGQVFGGVVQSIVLRSDDIFTETVLESVERLSVETGSLDGVQRVVSLFTVAHLSGEGGILSTSPLLDFVPNGDELAAIRADAISDELLLGEVINPDASATAIHLFLDSRPEDEDFEPRLLGEIERLLDEERAKLGGDVVLYQIGNPTLKQTTLEATRSDLATLGVAAIAAVGVALFFFFRTPIAALIPLVTGVLSILATLGFMGLVDYPLDPVAVMIPLLLLVVGCTEDVHLLSEYAACLRSGQDKDAAIHEMASRSGVAIFLTSLTTLIAFVTIAPNPIPMLHRFGVAASFGLAVNFCLTVLLVPTLLRWLPTPRAFLRTERESLGWLRVWVLRATRHPRAINLAAIVIAALSLQGYLRLVVDTDYLSFFRPDSEIQRLYHDVSDHLTGATSFLVVVDTGAPDGLKDPRAVADLARLTDYLHAEFPKAIGYVDFLRRIHQELNDGDPAFRRVPESADLVAQYTLLIDPDDLDRFVDFDMRRSAIVVRTSKSGSRDINAATRGILDFAAANLSRDLDVRVTGETILINKASDDISRSLVANLGWVVGAIFVLISVLFLSVKAGLLAMVPNVLPALLVFGFMGFSGIPLSTSTFSVVIIALGIAVDDTVHLMVRFSKLMQHSSDNEEVLTGTIREELRPVFVTSVVLMLGFSMLTLGELGSNVQFGILATLAMGAALLADLFLTPALLQVVPLIGAWDLLKLKISEEVIAASPLFRGLKVGEVKRLALLGELRSFAAGEHILRQDDVGRDLLVVLSGAGRTVVTDASTGQVRELEQVGAGGVLGEIALCFEGRRTASVIALEDVETLAIDGARLERMARRFPTVAAKLFRNIAALLGQRLSRTSLAYAREDRGR